MKPHPFWNAAGAAAYIGLVVLFLQYLNAIGQNVPDNRVLDPMGAISLLVFSVAVMAYLFFYQPAVLLIDGKKKEALAYFFTTLAVFGVITAAIFAVIALSLGGRIG